MQPLSAIDTIRVYLRQRNTNNERLKKSRLQLPCTAHNQALVKELRSLFDIEDEAFDHMLQQLEEYGFITQNNWLEVTFDSSLFAEPKYFEGSAFKYSF